MAALIAACRDRVALIAVYESYVMGLLTFSDVNFHSFLMENCLTVQTDECGGYQYPLQVIVGVLKSLGD